MNRRVALTIAAMLLASPAFAQESVVIQAKADLRAAGRPVENAACTDFEIAKVVAGRLRAQGAGLLVKDCCGDANDPNRSHCELNGVWYAHDIIAFADGTLVDIASDGGGANGPTWQASPPDPSVIPRYRGAAALGLTGVVPGGPIPPPEPPPAPPVSVDLQPILDRLTELQHRFDALQAKMQELLDRPTPAPPAIVFPRYEGNTKAFGGALVLTPKP